MLSPRRVLSHPLQRGWATASGGAHCGPGQERFTEPNGGFLWQYNPRSSTAKRSHWLSSASPHTSAPYSTTRLPSLPALCFHVNGERNARWWRMQPTCVPAHLPSSHSRSHSLTCEAIKSWCQTCSWMFFGIMVPTDKEQLKVLQVWSAQSACRYMPDTCLIHPSDGPRTKHLSYFL